MTFRLLAPIAALAGASVIGADAALAENRMLVIGNANHASVSPLSSSANNATAMVQFPSTAASARADGGR